MGFFDSDTDIKTVDPYAGLGLRELYGQLNNWISPQIGQSAPVYQGQMYAGASPLQQAAFSGAGQISPNIGNMFNNIGQYQSYGNQALDSIMQSPNAQENVDYWKQSFVNPAMSQWGDMQKSILERFAGMNAGSSGGLNRSLSRAASDFSTNLSGQLGQIGYNTQQNYLNRLQNVPSLASQTAGITLNALQGGFGTLSSLAGLGSQQQAANQIPLNEAYQKWQMGQSYNNPYLQNYLQLALSQPGKETIATQSPSMFSSLIGPAAQLGGSAMIAGALCDERMKENVDDIDSALEKLKTLSGKTYNYIGKNNRNAGVMAQDVEKILPESVEEINGVKYVRFDGMIALIVNAIKELDNKLEIA